MKKLLYFIMLSAIFFAISENANAKPIYVTVRIGFFAKWEITSGACESGWGICLVTPVFPDDANASLGFDEVNPNLFYLKIKRTAVESKYLTNGKFEVHEDSPVDPKLLAQFSSFKNLQKKVVVIRKGTYAIVTNDDYYTIALNYYLQ